MNAIAPATPHASHAGSAQRRWMAELAALTYPQDPATATKALMVYLPPLVADFPPSAWCNASMLAVAQAKRRMAIPGYDEVHAALSVWWRENRPYPVALPAPCEPERTPPTQAEIDAVRATLETHKGELAELAKAEPRHLSNRPVRNLQDDKALAHGLAQQLQRRDLDPAVRAAFGKRYATLCATLGLREMADA